MFAEDSAATSGADQALALLRDEGGTGLLTWLQTQRTGRRGKARKSRKALMTYVRTQQPLMDDPDDREAGWPIGSGMIESTGKPLVGLRLKGPGRHWTEAGALAVTALRATDLNGDWHPFWNSRTLTKCTATK